MKTKEAEAETETPGAKALVQGAVRSMVMHLSKEFTALADLDDAL